MARVLVTGAAGFIGRRLTAALLEAGSLSYGGTSKPLTHITLTDRAGFDMAAVDGVAIEQLAGDIADPAFRDALASQPFDSIFHLASSLTLEAEQNPAHAFATNVEPLRHLLDGARARPMLVYTSSIAVFGGELPEEVDDTVIPAPQTTYGAHKAICELLIADYSRHGRVDGRALRLPIVLIRPGAPTGAVSDRLAAIVREPLAGRDAEAPLAPETRIAVASAGAVARALIALHDVPAGDLPPRRAMNLPALTVRVSEMVDALHRCGAAGRRGKVRYAPDDTMQAIVAGWPAVFTSQAARRLGLGADEDFAAVIADYLADVGDGA